MKKIGSIVLGTAVSAGLLALALRNVTFAELAHSLAGVRPVWFLPMLGIVVADLAIRAVRWRLLLSGALPNGARPGVWQLLRLQAVGLAVNNVLFLRLGEFARAYLAGTELGVPTLSTLATIFVERALDMMSLLTLFVAASAMHPEVVPAPLRAAAMAAVAALGIGLVIVVYADRQLKGNGPWERRMRKYPRLHQVVVQAAAGSFALQSPLVLLQVVALSLSLWLVDAGIYWVAGQAMALEPGLGYGRCVVVLSTAAAASALPTVPGAFGAFEQFVKALLVQWRVPEAPALAYAGLVHMVPYLVVTVVGIGFLYRAGHSLGSLGAALRSAATR